MRTLVVDPSAVIREKVTGFIADIPGIQIVGEASSWSEVIPLIQDLEPKVIIVDHQVLESPGTQSIRNLKEVFPRPYLILLADMYTPEYEHVYKKAGADFVIDKSLGLEQLVEILTFLSHQ